jgi:hypothetical protein
MKPNQTLETNCRPASPLHACGQFGRAIHAPACLPAAVAQLSINLWGSSHDRQTVFS